MKKKLRSTALLIRYIGTSIPLTLLIWITSLGLNGSTALAATETTCTNGSIAPGVYSSLTVAGTCTVDSGAVTVQHNLTVLPGATLIAVTGGVDGNGFGPPFSSDLTVGGNLNVQAGAVLNLGCEPIAYPCANDTNPFPGLFSTQHTVTGNLTADNALAVVIHHTSVLGNLSINGGGGGVSCASSLPALFFAPPYGDFENMTIGGQFSITGWQSCWLGVFRTTVAHNLTLTGNTTFDPDGNEVAHNTVGGNLSCNGNVPANQAGDSAGGPNTVLGNVTGQCSALVK